MRITLREMLLAVAVIAISVGWYLDRRSLTDLRGIQDFVKHLASDPENEGGMLPLTYGGKRFLVEVSPVPVPVGRDFPKANYPR